jgi:hypothetical protein
MATAPRLRITGEETVPPPRRLGAADGQRSRAPVWSSCCLLTSPEVAPGTPVAAREPQPILVGERGRSPEAAGIFRIFRPQADPKPAESAQAPVGTGDNADQVPLPRRRPEPPAVISARETLLLAAAPQ